MVDSNPPDCRLNPYSLRMVVSSGAKTCRSAALIMKVSASSPNETTTTTLGTGPSVGRSFTRDGAGLAGTASIGIASIGSGYIGTTCSPSEAVPVVPGSRRWGWSWTSSSPGRKGRWPGSLSRAGRPNRTRTIGGGFPGTARTVTRELGYRRHTWGRWTRPLGSSGGIEMVCAAGTLVPRHHTAVCRRHGVAGPERRTAGAAASTAPGRIPQIVGSLLTLVRALLSLAPTHRAGHSSPDEEVPREALGAAPPDAPAYWAPRVIQIPASTNERALGRIR